MEEPRYVDDPFADEDTAWQHYHDLPKKWHYLVIEAFNATGRTSHTFRDRAEKNKWKNITSKLDKGTMSKAWAINCISYYRKMNESAPLITHTFVNLTKYILNLAKMTDWQKKNPSKVVTLDDYEFD